MADCFISYRRTPSAPIAILIQEKLQNQYDIDAYVDTTRTDGSTVQFPERLMQAIEDAPVFVCLLGDRDGQHTLESKWVLKEIERAHELGKFCVPIFQESYTPIDNPSQAVNYLLNHDGIHIFDQKNIMIDNSIADIAKLIQPHRIRSSFPRLLFPLIALAIILLGIASVVLFMEDGNDDGALSTEENTQTAIALVPTGLIEPNVTETPLPTDTLIPITTDTPTSTPTLSPEEVALTPVTSNADWIPYQREFNGVTMMLVPAGSFMMGSTQADIDFAFELCEQAADNEAECQRSWFEDELSSIDNTQIFTRPFWIDKYEVTRFQYQQCVDRRQCEETPNSDFSTEANQPINQTTWFNAQAYCQWRDGRLPTEAEWQYSARGVDGLTFPWDNEENDIPANHCDSNCGEASWASDYTFVNEENDDNYAVTSPVGSFPDGASWVGALDMAGNVWEWTSSFYGTYPYSAVYESSNGESGERVLGGGSFLNSTLNLRSAGRGRLSASTENGGTGFRCARDFDLNDESTSTSSNSTTNLVSDRIALTPVTFNAEWTPVEREFNDVTMILVPVGCFMMGSNDGDADEQPVDEQCFDEPFWIDQTEVTRAQYQACISADMCQETTSESLSIDPNHPMNRVTWFEAQAYCEWLGGRLPTESEWEYSARGVDNLAYPWGNEFVAENVVYSSNSAETAFVGSRPAGASWVGAMDMVGNVWEWTSSLYADYPYDEEHESNTDVSSMRVMRGGSFYTGSNLLRSAVRAMNTPSFVNVNLGFRCARDFDG